MGTRCKLCCGHRAWSPSARCDQLGRGQRLGSGRDRHRDRRRRSAGDLVRARHSSAAAGQPSCRPGGCAMRSAYGRRPGVAVLLAALGPFWPSQAGVVRTPIADCCTGPLRGLCGAARLCRRMGGAQVSLGRWVFSGPSQAVPSRVVWTAPTSQSRALHKGVMPCDWLGCESVEDAQRDRGRGDSVGAFVVSCCRV